MLAPNTERQGLQPFEQAHGPSRLVIQLQLNVCQLLAQPCTHPAWAAYGNIKPVDEALKLLAVYFYLTVKLREVVSHWCAGMGFFEVGASWLPFWPLLRWE